MSGVEAPRSPDPNPDPKPGEAPWADPYAAGADATLVDVLDRLLDHGVVVRGDLRISVAGVDLLYVGLNLVAASVDAIEAPSADRRDAPGTDER